MMIEIPGVTDEIVEGVIVTNPTDAAHERADAIRRGIDAWTEVIGLIIEAYKAQDWKALGYPDWQEYVGKEFETNLLKLNAKIRKEWIPQLKKAGMSTREIAPVLNVDQSTVVRDAKASDGAGSPGDELKKMMKHTKTVLEKISVEIANVDASQEWVKSDIREIANLVKGIKESAKADPKETTDDSRKLLSGEEMPTAKQVNDWLKSQGKPVARGRVSDDLKWAYIEAHRQ